jgi:hypothetical protein
MTGLPVPGGTLNPIRAVLGIHHHRFDLFVKCSSTSSLSFFIRSFTQGFRFGLETSPMRYVGRQGPGIAFGEAEQMGFRLAIVPGLLFKVVIGVCDAMLSELRSTDRPVPMHSLTVRKAAKRSLTASHSSAPTRRSVGCCCCRLDSRTSDRAVRPTP